MWGRKVSECGLVSSWRNCRAYIFNAAFPSGLTIETYLILFAKLIYYWYVMRSFEVPAISVLISKESPPPVSLHLTDCIQSLQPKSVVHLELLSIFWLCSPSISFHWNLAVFLLIRSIDIRLAIIFHAHAIITSVAFAMWVLFFSDVLRDCWVRSWESLPRIVGNT